MRALTLLLGAIAIACSGSSDESASGPTTDLSRNEPVVTGENELHGCADPGATELVRCAEPEHAVVVCGDLAADSGLDVPGSVGRTCEQRPDVTAASGADGGERLAKVSNPSTLDLGCGRYRFTSIGIDNQLTLRVAGNTVIVVDGDVRVASPVLVSLAEGARLDLVVAGSMDVKSWITFEGGSTWLSVGGDLRIASGVGVRVDNRLPSTSPNGCGAR